MTSSNGNIFRVTGHLCGEFIAPRWIHRTNASGAELWCFLWSASEERLSKQSWGWWLRRYRAHYGVIVIILIVIVERIRQFVTPKNIEKITISITYKLTVRSIMLIFLLHDILCKQFKNTNSNGVCFYQFLYSNNFSQTSVDNLYLGNTSTSN